MSTTGRLDGKNVVLVVTGGIAAYKSCELVRRLGEDGAEVRVAMTRAATRFVGETTFAALSGQPVIVDLFADSRPEDMAHVRWAERADLLCVAPATADFLARMAHGIADDFASTLALAIRGPVMVAPAMEDDMYRHAATQRNLVQLAERGVHVVGPAVGELASGRSGPGRMVEPHELLAEASRLLQDGLPDPWLRGRRVLVTAGPTREPIDAVRYLGNRSSGRMGRAIAAEAARLGARTTLITGPSDLPVASNVHRFDVERAAEMSAATLAEALVADIVVMAAAVADFTPAEVAGEKIKKDDRQQISLELCRTVDILAQLGQRQPRPFLVGFAAETSQVRERGAAKMQAKGCDVLVANRVGADGGMGGEDNEVVVLDRWGGEHDFGPAPKARVATFLWKRLRQLLAVEGAGDRS